MAGPRTFALISEGITDRVIVESLLLGVLQQDEDEPALNPVELGPRLPPKPDQAPPGGWTLVFEALRGGKAAMALKTNDFVVIQVDTDVCEHEGFDVPRRAEGRELTPEELVAHVRVKLESLMDPSWLEANRDRILFAIAVNEMECWLLPLLYDPAAKRRKTTGCLEAANHSLDKRNEAGLASGKGEKFYRRYEATSKPYRKRDVILKHREDNPSLRIFVDALLRLAPGDTSRGGG